MSSRKGSEIRGNRKSALIGTSAGWAMRLLAMTLRLEVRDDWRGRAPDREPQPAIYLLWHSRFFIVPAAWRKISKGRRKVVALTSASHDGDMVARAMAVFGLGAVRGSSSRRGVAALVALKKALKEGCDICVTPDGPRGPRYKMQPGGIKLAESTGAPIVPVHVVFSSAWRLKTWDRFVIPKPFSKVLVTFAEPIFLARGMDGETLEKQRLEIENLMIQRTDDA